MQWAKRVAWKLRKSKVKEKCLVPGSTFIGIEIGGPLKFRESPASIGVFIEEWLQEFLPGSLEPLLCVCISFWIIESANNSTSFFLI